MQAVSLLQLLLDSGPDRHMLLQPAALRLYLTFPCSITSLRSASVAFVLRSGMFGLTQEGKQKASKYIDSDAQAHWRRPDVAAVVMREHTETQLQCKQKICLSELRDAIPWSDMKFTEALFMNAACYKCCIINLSFDRSLRKQVSLFRP